MIVMLFVDLTFEGRGTTAEVAFGRYAHVHQHVDRAVDGRAGNPVILDDGAPEQLLDVGVIVTLRQDARNDIDE